MLDFFQSPSTLGLEIFGSEIRGAEISLQKGNFFIKKIFSSPLSQTQSFNDVKRIYIHNSPILVAAADANDVLIRPLYMPLIKEKDIEAAFTFQAEPILPYPVEQAILTRQQLNQTAEGTNLTVFSLKKDLIEKKLETWQQIGVEPEQISCIQMALANFGKVYLKQDKPYLILHIGPSWSTCVLVKEGKLIASYAHQEGIELIRNLFKEKNKSDDTEFLEEEDFFNSAPEIQESIKRLQQSLARMIFALIKECRGETLAGLLMTGEAIDIPGLEEKLTEKLELPLLQCEDLPQDTINSKDRRSYAVPIGLGIGALEKSIDFRKDEFSFPHPWRRMAIPLGSYFILMLLLTLTFYAFGKQYLHWKEDLLKQEYVSLLFDMNKSYEGFENTFLAKNSSAREKQGGEIIPIADLTRQDLQERLEFINRDLQASPDSFPLFPNTPTVSDVLAWLSSHPMISHKNKDGSIESRLQLENFSYSMLKRPAHGKKQEKYQVKVELEFSSPAPKWAREFHDALITSNDYVDPKGEVKWSSNRGRYRTSFYLKDKTSYNQ